MNTLQAKVSKVSPEHENIAIQFASEMIDRFQPYERVEILAKIKQVFSEDLRQQIGKAQLHIEDLQAANERLFEV